MDTSINRDVPGSTSPGPSRSPVRAMVMVVGVVVGSTLVLGGAVVAANEVLFHGFPPGCSDPSIPWSRQSCGISWRAGFPALAVLALGLAVMAAAVGTVVFVEALSWIVGASSVLAAVLLLCVGTWFPTPPAPPEPVGPQLVLLAAGVSALVGARCLSRRPGAPASGGRHVRAADRPQRDGV